MSSKTALVEVDDVPEEVKRCENEYTIHYGVEGRLEMKGNFYDLTDTIKKRLLMNYERCRRVDVRSPHLPPPPPPPPPRPDPSFACLPLLSHHKLTL